MESLCRSGSLSIRAVLAGLVLAALLLAGLALPALMLLTGLAGLVLATLLRIRPRIVLLLLLIALRLLRFIRHRTFSSQFEGFALIGPAPPVG
jgi:hypothetical protein